MTNLFEISKKLSTSALTEVINLNQNNKEIEILQKINIEKIKSFNLKRTFIKKNLKKVVIFFNATNYGEVTTKSKCSIIEKINSSQIKKDSVEDIKNRINNSIVILTNNIFFEIGTEKLFELQKICNETVWIIQDYDNHHWIENSVQAAIFSDIYIPSHMDGEIGLLGKINSNIIDYIPCGSNQWSSEFIDSNIRNIKLEGRSQYPFGKYYFYEKFKSRNKYIQVLNSNFQSINFTDKDFHKITMHDKWREWTAHSIHWIIPTANDLPIRFFDALITGGIPLVPITLSPYLNFLNVNKNYYLTYTQLDVYEPANIITSARFKINQGGDIALRERSEYAYEKFHVDKIIDKILLLVESLAKTH
jgi:hypothetical protein